MPSLTMTPLEAHQEIEKAARAPIVEHRQIPQLKPGEWCRQGDVYLERIAKVTPDWKVSGYRQLAPGTSPGSRHVVTAGPVLRISPEAMPRVRASGGVRLLGPQISAKEAFTVEHPEHAHLCLPAGDYQVSYQLDYHQQQAVRD